MQRTLMLLAFFVIAGLGAIAGHAAEPYKGLPLNLPAQTMG